MRRTFCYLVIWCREERSTYWRGMPEQPAPAHGDGVEILTGQNIRVDARIHLLNGDVEIHLRQVQLDPTTEEYRKYCDGPEGRTAVYGRLATTEDLAVALLAVGWTRAHQEGVPQ